MKNYIIFEFHPYEGNALLLLFADLFLVEEALRRESD